MTDQPQPPPPPPSSSPPKCSKELNRYKEERDNSAYRQVEKSYKRQRVPINRRQSRFIKKDPDLSQAIDFATVPPAPATPLPAASGDDAGSPRVKWVKSFRIPRPPGQLQEGGEGDESEQCCHVYALPDRPGFYYIRNALDLKAQAYWVRCCLREFSQSPFTNLTNLHGPQPEAMELWERALERFRQAEGRGKEEEAVLQELQTLRWVNMGLNYVWTLRQYAIPVKEQNEDGEESSSNGAAAAAADAPSEDNSKKLVFPIPQKLKELSRQMLLPLDLDDDDDASSSSSFFEAEAGIVNYYPQESSMGGHVDDAEGALDQPIVSFSLGLGGVYLLGGVTKDIPPIAMVFRSGDCMVMAKEARLCYHGVPCVLMDSAGPLRELTDAEALVEMLQEEDDEEVGGEDDKEKRRAEARLLAKYLATSRINFNVRQVWKRKQKKTPPPCTAGEQE